jgi:hypothetical protein
VFSQVFFVNFNKFTKFFRIIEKTHGHALRSSTAQRMGSEAKAQAESPVGKAETDTTAASQSNSRSRDAFTFIQMSCECKKSEISGGTV